MELKAISPVVAAVLLISVTLSLGVIVTSWVRNWIMKETSDPQISCVLQTNYVIDTAEYDSSSQKLTVKVTNKGSQKIYDFGLILDNGTNIKEYNSSSPKINTSPIIDSSNRLGREKMAYIKLNMTNSTIDGSTLTEVRATNKACEAVSAKTTSITQS